MEYMDEVKFSARAYAKIILHAAKYPHCAVNGVLLIQSQGGIKKQLDFVDCVPLFHDCLHVSPMAEVALTQIDNWATNESLTIAGYYTASENLRNNSIERSNHRIADKIAENFNQACLVVVDNYKLSPHQQTKDFPLKVAQQISDGKWKQIAKAYVYPMDADLAVSSLVREKTQKTLIDFDNHLDNIKLDWTNKKINTDVDEVVKLYVECNM